MTLEDLPDRSTGHVTGVLGDPLLRERLVEMGLTAGTLVEVRRRAPFGGPLELRLRGGVLALRRDEARCVSVGASVGTSDVAGGGRNGSARPSLSAAVA